MSDLVKSLIAGISTKESIEQAKQLSEEEMEKKRLELAGAITRRIYNMALTEAKERQKIFEETKNKGENQG
jgi:hypothetical protein